MGDLQELEGCSSSRCGALEVAFAYDYPTRKLTAQVLQARDVPSRERGGASSAQVSTAGAYCGLALRASM